MVSLWFPSISYGQHSKPDEYQIKAVYLYNFSRFVVWPRQIVMSRNDSFAICVLGRDPFGPALDKTLVGENVEGKNLVARRLAKPEEAGACQILFVSVSEEDRLKEILAVLDKTSVLTVSDIPRFSQRGGMIQFVLEGDKVRFEVNLTNATQNGLTLSSDLLKVAVAVRSKLRTAE
jgi:YfiR/HmsC-like